MSFQTSALLLSWVAILLLALVVSGLVRQVHALTAAPRQARPATGSQAPRFAELAPTVPGPLLLMFAGPGCRTCAALVPEAARYAGAGVAVRALYPGAVPADAPADARGAATELFELYHVVATPWAVLVGLDGRIVESLPVGSVDVLHAVLDRAAPHNGVPQNRDKPAYGESGAPQDRDKPACGDEGVRPEPAAGAVQEGVG